MKELRIKKLLKICEKSCTNCGSLLVKTHSRRNLQDLEKNYFIDSEIGRCTNISCPCKEIRIYPTK